MKYRSISSHRGCPDPQVIDLAAKLGFNDVCFQVEGEQSVMLKELRDRWDRSKLIQRIHGHGMSVSVWVHEFEDIDPTWGELSLSNAKLWNGLEKRYQKLLREDLPEIDWLVLTVVESTVRVTDPAMLEKLILLLRSVCADCGKQLMVRSFVWTLDEFHGVREAIGRLPDDVTIMTKIVPQDWHRADNHDPLIGEVGEKDQIIELDIAGEYFRGEALAHCYAEDLHSHFQYWEEKGVDGVSVRVDRGWQVHKHHDNILHEVQESNLWCLGMWANGVCQDIDTPLIAWATERFGEAASQELASIARLCDGVVKEALTVCGEPFGDTRRLAPALRSMLPPKEEPATIHHLAKADNHRDPFSRWLALWRWDHNLKPRYEKLRRGDATLAQEKKESVAQALVHADEALTRLDSIRHQLSMEAFEFLRFKLEENRHHLVLMGEAAQAWLVCLRIPEQPENTEALHKSIETHLQAMESEWKAHQHESAVVIWPEGRTRYLQRCTHVDVPLFCREMRRYAGINKA